MGTKPEAPEPEPTPVEKAEGFLRNAIAGHPRGALRRIVMYIGLVVALVLLGSDVLTPLTLAVGVVMVLLLASTDSLA